MGGSALATETETEWVSLNEREIGQRENKSERAREKETGGTGGRIY